MTETHLPQLIGMMARSNRDHSGEIMIRKGRPGRGDGKKPLPPLMSKKEIRIRAESSFFALPLALQESYLILMEAHLARVKGDLLISGACLGEE